MTALAPVAPGFFRLASATLPASARLLAELPLWIVLTAGALLPGRLAGAWEWGGEWRRPLDAAVVVAAASTLVLVMALVRRRDLGGASVLGTWLALIAFAALSMSWALTEPVPGGGMGWTLAVSAATAILGALVWTGRGAFATVALLDRLTGFVSVTAALYTLESAIGIGFREPGARLAETAWGWERVRGPLFSASTGYLMLVPALGWCLTRINWPNCRGRWWAVFASGALVLALLGLGSRAAVVVTTLFLAASPFFARRARWPAVRWMVLAGLGALLFAGLAGLVFDRVESWEDPGRRATHGMAWRRLTAEPAVAWRGAGYGGIWAWYTADTLEGPRIAGGDNLIPTPYGAALYHSHSVLLELALELGLAGVVLAAVALARAMPPLLARAHPAGPLRAALVASMAAFAFDLYLFKNTTVSLVWWLYLFGALQLTAARRS